MPKWDAFAKEIGGFYSGTLRAFKEGTSAIRDGMSNAKRLSVEMKGIRDYSAKSGIPVGPSITSYYAHRHTGIAKAMYSELGAATKGRLGRYFGPNVSNNRKFLRGAMIGATALSPFAAIGLGRRMFGRDR